MELILQCFIAVIFGLAILGKLTGKTKSTFEKAGYSPLFRYALAVVELALTIGIFTAFGLYAVIGLLLIILGAIFTLFRQNAKLQQYIMAFIAVGLLLGLYWVVYS